MAQAFFEEHPLEEYLRESGEAPELMPGGSSEFIESDEQAFMSDMSPREGYISNATILLQSLLARLSNRPPPFVERFKYDIISSSLLSDSLAPSYTARMPVSPTFPGNISSHESSQDNSTVSSISLHTPTASPPSSDYWMSSLALVLVALSVGAGYYFLAILALGGTVMTVHLETMEVKHDMKPSMDALQELVFSGNVWDSVIQEVLTILEKDERYIFSGPGTPSSASSSLRVALNSTLHTTQTQCDNVRQLFAALTSPSELSPLSEMYAPPFPQSHKGFSSPTHSTPDARPLSLPTSSSSYSGRTRTRSLTTRGDKRSTWNGSYSTLASAGSPTPQILKRREKRRSDLSSLLGMSISPLSVSVSAPVTPAENNGLFEVEEEQEESINFSFPSEDSFGSAALDLQRKRRSAGFEALALRHTPTSAKFASIQPPRHPLSLSALQSSLQSALAARRYACSHLLALRFDEEDDESYWEDVRSVMSLLTSTLADAAARLTEALEENERLRLRFENPSPESLPPHSRSVSANFESGKTSFAPMPSHMARFGAHVDAISSALNDARENMEACVSVLHEGTEPMENVQEHPAILAYERLRRELGLALRECERGRERLLDIVSPPRQPEVDDEEEDEKEDMDDLPSLGSSGQGRDDSSSLDEMHASDGEEPEVSVHHRIEDEVLPSPGIEQVFEGDSGTEAVWTREKSKLSREERIRLAKERRESQTILLDDKPKWGPGGEVVQELKDVIWKVGEKRRRMASGSGSFDDASDFASDPAGLIGVAL